MRQAVRRSYQLLEQASHMTRKKVLDGFLRAAEIAELTSDSSAMTGAWREIGKMCGYYAIETKRLEVTVNGEVAIKKLSTLSDEDLLKMASGQVIDGEFAQIAEGMASEGTETALLDDLEALE